MGARNGSNAFAELVAACHAAVHAGAFPQALVLAERAVKQRPHAFEALHLNAIALQRLGRLRSAIAVYRRALRAHATSADGYHNFGCALLEAGQLAEGAAALERALELRPDYAPSYDGLGFARTELGDLAGAVASFERALELDPAQPMVRGRLGHVLLRMQRFAEARVRYAEALEGAPESSELLDGLGVALDRTGHADEAVVVFHRALALNSKNANAACNLGKVLLSRGTIEEAMLWFDRAIELEPQNGSFYLPLVTGGSKSVKPEHADAMIRLSHDIDTLPKTQQIDLHFALGNIYERRGLVDDAFRHLLAGNALKRHEIPYDERAVLTALHVTLKAFSDPFLDELRGCGDPSERPIFIVGMPRSGSTLVEQVLAAHPLVAGAGEIGTFGEIVREVWPTLAATSVEELRAKIRGIGERYVESTAAFAGTARFVTDKTLENAQYLPLIQLALPNARIIHTQRDELDTCFSCFSTFFSDNLVPFSYDLRELGNYYGVYRTMMQRWRAFVSADRLLDVSYETLVADFEGEARRLLAFCGIPWDPACLRFYEAQRPVRTASNLQVRQPLYGNSVGRARPFLALLGTLIAGLAGGSN